MKLFSIFSKSDRPSSVKVSNVKASASVVSESTSLAKSHRSGGRSIGGSNSKSRRSLKQHQHQADVDPVKVMEEFLLREAEKFMHAQNNFGYSNFRVYARREA